jgi:hypothetical protein
LLRCAGETDATVWVETDSRCTVEVLGHTADTFCVAGHPYRIVHVEGLGPDSCTPYEVLLDGDLVWPLPDWGWPASVIRTTAPDRPVDVVFGSCRVSYPHEPPYTLTKDEHPLGRELDALGAFAHRMREQSPEQWPGALLLLGDQIYADEVAPATKEFIRSRRDPDVPPGETLAGFQEYAHLYGIAWSEPAMRWLLSTVPSAMIFDDHDVIDDWNTSHRWVDGIRGCGWWDERIVGAFASYWVYQHIGNLSPAALAEDHHFRTVCSEEDGEEPLREFAWRADRSVDSTQWSYCRDIGAARLIMVDSRAGRVLDRGERRMVDPDEWDFIERNATTSHHDHVLIGTSLPWLLAPGMHHLEAWNEAVCDGAWGELAARGGEALRQALDLEHWAAFGHSFRRLAGIVADLGAGRHGEPPATIIALSGDVHHAYLAEVAFPHSAAVRSRVYQAVCSPLRNPLDTRERRAIRAISSRPMAGLARALARAAGVDDPPIRWRIEQDPVFDNVVATLRLDGRAATLRIERVRPHQDAYGRLETVLDRAL